MAEALPAQFGDYQLIARLGGGGMGDVYLARPNDPNSPIPTPIVIKRLHGQLADQEQFVRRFHHEAKVAERINSRHITKVFDSGQVGETLFIAMEHVNGWTLERVISELKVWDRKVSISSIIDLMIGILEGLEALHTACDASGQPLGMVHRDIGPKNVMIGEDGVPHLIDLGLGSSRIQDWKTSTGMILGSPGYMPPEQVLGKPADQRADIYAVGVVMLELLTLTPYIRRGAMARMLMDQAEPTFRPPSQSRPDVPAALDQIERTALAIDPADRFASARAFINALVAVRQQLPVDPSQPSLLDKMNPQELFESKTQITQMVANAAAQTQITAMPMPDAEAYMNVPTQVVSTAPVSTTIAPSSRLPSWAMIIGAVAMLITFGAGLYVGRAEKVVTLDGANMTDVAEPPEPDAPAAVPGAVGTPGATQPATGAPQPTAAVVEHPPPAPVQAAPAPPRAPELAEVPSVPAIQARIDGLTERARRLVAAFGRDAAQKAEAMNTLRQLMRRRTSPRLQEMLRDIDALERDVERLEASADG